MRVQQVLSRPNDFPAQTLTKEDTEAQEVAGLVPNHPLSWQGQATRHSDRGLPFSKEPGK